MRLSRLALPLVATTLLVPLATGLRALQPLADGQGGDLSAYVGPNGGLVRDTNGDGIADAIAARVIVPSVPTLADSSAAANIAGRLGFETSAMSLPLVLRDSAVADPARVDVPVLVGRSNRFVSALHDKGDFGLGSLAPGQGLIVVVPGAIGGGPGIVVTGNDDKGTEAAGVEFAARLPRVWNASGVTLAGVKEQVARVLRGRSINPTALAVGAIVVDAERRGIARLVVRATVPAAQVQAAQRTLDALDQAHRRGLEPLTLNFAEVARTSVELWVDGRLAATGHVGRSGLNARTLTPPINPNELAPDSPGDRGRPADSPAGRQGKVFDLSNPYSIAGWYGDVYTDLIPDRTDTSIILGRADDALGAAHVAARLGLETTGVALPIARSDADVRDASREASPILVGRDNRLVRELVSVGRARLDDLQAGDGVVQIVPNAFGSVTATVVAGADPAGTEAASEYLARRVPYVWDYRRGALTYGDVRTELRRFLDGKSVAGQAAQAVSEIDRWLTELGDVTVTGVDAKLSLEIAEPAFDTFLTGYLRRALPDAKVTVSSQAMTASTPVIDETIEVPWEVDEFRARFRKDVLPAVTAGAKVSIETRLSESPAVRMGLVDEVRAELQKAGAASSDVKVLSAYKQGFMWISEQVLPALKGKGVARVHIKAAELKPDLSKAYKFHQVPSRWLQELYPIDEVIARELRIDKSAVSLELADAPKDIYTVEALDAGGRVLQAATFSPTFAAREYLDKFPGWSRVDVTTGWLSASVNGKSVSDGRIQTDPERFWDQYQSQILPRIYDHVMRVTNNQPLPDKQPFHRDLDVEVWMSEPDFRIGVDEELVSSLEALHEDLYFVTLDFYDALGRTTTKRRLAAPGKIFPIIHPELPGKPGKVHVRYAGNASTKPQLDMRVTTAASATSDRVNRDLGRIEASVPAPLRAVVRPDRVRELELRTDARNDREATRAAGALRALARLHEAGLFRTALSFDKVERVSVAVSLDGVVARHLLPATGAFAASNVVLAAQTPQLPLISWKEIISPEESEALVAKLSAFPEARAYKAGQSYRGRDISVLELTLPTPSDLVSLAKLTTLKPTIFITGRQHANEVSSTSHILRLGELLVSDPAYKVLLKKVNIVLHPVENPDGAAMHYELQKLTPTHMLHAGRYSALGMDVQSQVGLPDPLLPEALVRGRVWQEWLPDIYLNPHGYPSHEWTQPFAGYVPPGFRTYWTTRGWYTSIGGLRDPRYPGHQEGVEALREAIVREINKDTDVRAMNLRHQGRYRKWAFGFSPYVFGQEIYKDTAIYYTDLETGEPRGPRVAGQSRFGGGGGRVSMQQWPQVTFVSGGTETPDETAQGDWLTLVTKPGFSYLMAHLTYLRDGRYQVERIEEEGARDGSQITLLRVRPVRPGTLNPPPMPPATPGGGGR